jgi:NAD-dependent protein deacetylases, SIR2 family
MKYTEQQLLAAHRHTAHHRAEVEQSAHCACFDCGATFRSSDITAWIDDGHTALCPACGMDCVLGDASGYHLCEDFLEQMRRRWM